MALVYVELFENYLLKFQKYSGSGMSKSIKELFKRSIRNGTGEALLLLMENPLIDFDEYILEACTRNLAYDPQCEGSRQDYLYEVWSLSRNKESIKDSILNELLSPAKEGWDVDLLFDLSVVFAQHGDAAAKEAIYLRYARNLATGYEFVETDALIILDGLQGLEFVASVQGKQLALDSSYWVEGYLLDLCEKYFPDSSPKKYLKEKAQGDPDIELFLSGLEENDRQRAESKLGAASGRLSLKQILQRIEEGKTVPFIAGKWLSEAEALVVANKLVVEQDQGKVQAYLRLLSRTPYLLDVSTILPFLTSTNEQIRESTLFLLRSVADPRIRILIEEKYNDTSYIYEHVELFVSNFREHDLAVLCDLLDTLEDESEVHYFGMLVRDMLERNVVKDASRLLEKLYAVTNCSVCRGYFVKKMMLANQLSAKLIRELRYDCEPELRSQAGAYRSRS